MPAWCRSSRKLLALARALDREREGPPGKGRRPGRRRDAPRPPRPCRSSTRSTARTCRRALHLRRWARAALDGAAAVTIRFVGAREGQRLNAQFRGRDHATNVLTFVYDDGLPRRRRHRAVRAGAAPRGARAGQRTRRPHRPSRRARHAAPAGIRPRDLPHRRCDGAPGNGDPRGARHPGPTRSPAPRRRRRRRGTTTPRAPRSRRSA